MKRVAAIAVLIAAAALVAWRYPLFHIVRTNETAAKNVTAAFNARQFAETFWRERLVPSLRNAVHLETLLPALSANPEQVRKEHGRTVGVSRQTLYVVQAGGTIVSVDTKGVGVALGEEGGKADVVLQTGPLFGNAVRNCTGLVRPGDFANSQQFNDLSAELNRIAESRAIAPLKQAAAVGEKIHFAGCFGLSNDAADVKPLPVVPLQVRFEKPLETYSP